MKDEQLDRMTGLLFPAEKVSEVKPWGTGHINDTYLVNTANGKFILQRVNPSVFDTGALVHNYELLNRSAEDYQKMQYVKLTPRMLPTSAGSYHLLDENGAAWRKVEFLPGSKSFDITTDTRVSEAAAAAYGRFQLFLNTLDVSQFRETIPAFHHPLKRLQQFEKALEKAEPYLIEKAEAEIQAVEQFKPIVSEIESLLNSGKLPRRLSHYDTKLNNVIFHRGKPFVIDLDTVMPGTVLFDFGDMVRTFTSPAAEDEPDIERTVFRTSHFEALSKGYFGQLKNELSEIEKQNLLPGVKAIIFEQALRFLTDFLNGNIYYKTDYPDHNLVRCRTQLKLLTGILNKEQSLLNILQKILIL